MSPNKRIRIAGPYTEIGNGTMVERARAHLFVRQRVQSVIEEAGLVSGRRPVKGTGRWPGTLSNDVM